jgi:cellulose synthase/poly-beta-1,6-N-acetylglucosamine synthase-like glycosyltransferase
VERFISVIIATSGRVEKLRRLLDGLSRVTGREKVNHEIIVANNASDDNLADAVEGLVTEYTKCETQTVRMVREPVPGKCRAQNRAILQARGSIVAFLDDDLEVVPEWLESISRFFDSYPHDVMQGSVQMYPKDRDNAELREALQRYRTVDFIDYGFPVGADIRTLTGGNIAVRREVFDRVGLFNEVLGPGGYGISEDVEFAKRVLAAGKRIGYEPRAAVYNDLDPSRLTEEFFRLRHEQQGRSRLAYKKSSVFTIIPNLMRSLWAFGWYSLLGNERRTYRAKGRYFHYRAMLVEKAKRARG